MLVRSQVCDLFNDIHRCLCRRCRIQHRRNAVLRTQLNHIMHRVKRYFMLENNHVIPQQCVLYTVDIGTIYQPIGSLNDNNRIVMISYRDDRNSCRCSFRHLNVIGFHPVGDQVFHHLTSVIVVSDTSEHLNLGAKLCHGNRLIRSLAARDITQASTRQRLSFQRNTLRSNSLVNINTSNYC